MKIERPKLSDGWANAMKNTRDAIHPIAEAAGSSSFVRMFKPQFAELVERGEKLQTVRPTPKRMPEPGDRISLRSWTGKPYRSKQRVLREAVITKTLPITISALGCTLCGLALHDEEAFARADGFANRLEMLQWFETTHGLPFEGVLICWTNK
jgi:hypothetical protein